MIEIKQKFNLLTNHLILDKEKKQLELERFINDNNLSVDVMCNDIASKLNDYRDSIKNLEIWLEFIEPVNEPVNKTENIKEEQ